MGGDLLGEEWLVYWSGLLGYRLPRRLGVWSPEVGSMSAGMTQKRPFCLRLGDTIWRDLWDHEMGFRDLRDEIMVSLNFRDLSLELWGYRYREVPYWSGDQS